MFNPPAATNEKAPGSEEHPPTAVTPPHFEHVLRVTQRLFQVPLVLLTIVAQKPTQADECYALPARALPSDISFCTPALYATGTVAIEDMRTEPRFATHPAVTGEPHLRFYAGRPLLNHQGYTIGVLSIVDAEPRVLGSEEIKLLDALGAWAEMALRFKEFDETQKSLVNAIAEAKRKSMTDQMLDIWNRPSIREILAKEHARASKPGSELSLLMVDVDHFKDINDQFGHPAGDTVLIKLCNSLRTSLRPQDSLGRYGGEEFLIILPDTGIAVARDIAERLRTDAKAIDFEVDGDYTINITISVGCAGLVEEEKLLSPDEMISRADQKLLIAKSTGRNKVVV